MSANPEAQSSRAGQLHLIDTVGSSDVPGIPSALWEGRIYVLSPPWRSGVSSAVLGKKGVMQVKWNPPGRGVDAHAECPDSDFYMLVTFSLIFFF